MNDIAGRLGFTKAALYKHYTSKQEILDRIVERMNEMDYERAESYEMPETEPDGFAEAYLNTPIQKIRAYSMAQFGHWTKEPFSSNFRKMLTLETQPTMLPPVMVKLLLDKYTPPPAMAVQPTILPSVMVNVPPYTSTPPPVR